MSGSLAFVFPGQGTQRVGMGAMFRAVSAAAAAVYVEASDVMHVDIARLCAESDEHSLARTENAQVAIYTTNAAVLATVRAELGEPDAVAGHSVGEWSAFHAAGVVSFADGLRAVRERARLMAGLAGPGAMIAVAGLTADEVDRHCEQLRHREQLGPGNDVAVVAVENAPQLVVAAGDSASMSELTGVARAAGATRAVAVRTSHAFHSPLMAAALGPWRTTMGAVGLDRPSVPVALNHSGRLSDDPEVMRREAVDQIVDRVRWKDCLLALEDLGIGTVVEVGDSKTLTSFTRATLPDAIGLAMGAPSSLRSLKKLGGARHVVR